MHLYLVVAAMLSVVVPAQPNAPLASPQPSVTFSFEWNQGFPWQKYSIQVNADGKAHFDGTPNAEGPGDNGPFQQDFTISPENRQKIFMLAGRLNYFRGEYDARLKKIAQTGKKTLEYDSGQSRSSTTYNWSQNPDVQELTKIFQNIANTLDFGRKLEFQYRFDKLGLNERLKQLEELNTSHQVAELEAIEPILRKIADDPNIMHISQISAQRLLKSIPALPSQQNSAQP